MYLSHDVFHLLGGGMLEDGLQVLVECVAAALQPSACGYYYHDVWGVFGFETVLSSRTARVVFLQNKIR